MPIVCPHKLCKINLPTKKDIASAVSFFRVDELTSGQVNELIAIGGTETEY